MQHELLVLNTKTAGLRDVWEGIKTVARTEIPHTPPGVLDHLQRIRSSTAVGPKILPKSPTTYQLLDKGSRAKSTITNPYTGQLQRKTLPTGRITTASSVCETLLYTCGENAALIQLGFI